MFRVPISRALFIMKGEETTHEKIIPIDRRR